MAVNTTPVFGKNGFLGFARPGAANTASDGSGTCPDLFVAGADGARVDYITITNSQVTAGASAANLCRVFVTDSVGANPRLLQECLLAAATRSATVQGATNTISFPGGLKLVSGQKLTCNQHVYATATDLIDFVAVGESLTA